MRSRLARIAFLILSTFALKIASATPQTVRIDGMIYDNTGAPVSGTHIVVIKAYDAATAGNLLWTSNTYSAVNVANGGRFTINMDASVGSPSLIQQLAVSASSGSVWFEVSYDSNIVRPRFKAKGTTFALSAASADAIQSIAVSTAVPSTNSILSYDGGAWAPTSVGTLVSGSYVAKIGDTMSGTLNVGALVKATNYDTSVSNGQYKIGGNTVLSVGTGIGAGNLIVGPGGTAITSGTNNSIFGTSNSGGSWIAGGLTTTGANNSFFGTSAGYANTTGAQNTYIGSYAGLANGTGNNNTYLGYYAGRSGGSGSANVAVGANSGQNVIGSNDVFLGSGAGYYGSAVANSTVLGAQAGYNLSTATANNFMGYNAGYLNTTGGNNTFLGNSAGAAVTTANNLTIVGSGANANTSASQAVALGYGAIVNASSAVQLGTGTNATNNSLQFNGYNFLLDNGNATFNNVTINGTISGAGSANSVAKSGDTMTGDLGLAGSQAIPGRVLVLDSSRRIASSSMTSVQLGYLTGVTSDVQTQLNTISTSLIAGSGGPNAFSFTNQTGANLNSLTTSNTVTLGGFAGILYGVCNGCVAIIRNGVAFGGVVGFVPGDTIALQIQSSASPNTAVTASVQVGTTNSGAWSVTTNANSPSAIAFTDQTGAATNAAISSNAVTLGGSFSNITATCNAGCTGISRNGAGFVAGPVTGFNSGDTIAIQLMSSTNASTAVTASVTVGPATSSMWSVTTGSNAPTAFSFANNTGVGLNSVIASSVVTLSGGFTNLTATCTGGCIAISRNGGAWTAGPITGFNSGDTIAIEQMSSGSLNTGTMAAVSIGTVSSSPWYATTIASDSCTGTPAVGTVCADGTVYTGITSDGSVAMYAQRCDVGMSWNGSACSGSRATKVWSTGATVITGVTSTVTGYSNTAVLVSNNGNTDAPYAAATWCSSHPSNGYSDWYLPAKSELATLMTSYSAIGGFIGGGNYYLSSTEAAFNTDYVQGPSLSSVTDSKSTSRNVRCVRKGALGNTTANAFSFTNQTGVNLSATITSSLVTLSGGFTNLTATCSGACTAISRNGGAWSAGPVGGFNSGDTIQIQQLSSASFSTATTAGVTVGTTASGSWQATTIATDPCASSPSVGAVCADNTIYVGLSPDGNVPMYAMPCDYGMTWNGASCTGSRSAVAWSAGASISTGITSVTMGRSNTAALIALNGNGDGPYTAATNCSAISFGGHTDFYLPAKNELHVLNAVYATLGTFSSGTGYWSSTESNTSTASYETLSSGTQSGTSKNTTPYVRCVRR